MLSSQCFQVKSPVLSCCGADMLNKNLDTSIQVDTENNVTKGSENISKSSKNI